MKPQNVHVIRIYSADDGSSHFQDIDMPLLYPVARSQRLTKPLGTGRLFEFDHDFSADWHTSKKPVYFIYLQGSQKVEVSSGEKRIISAGDIILAADLVGRGHKSRALSKGRAIVIEIPTHDI